jgi:hypothetical protein
MMLERQREGVAKGQGREEVQGPGSNCTC